MMSISYLVHAGYVDHVEVDVERTLVDLLALFSALHDPGDTLDMRLGVVQKPIVKSKLLILGTLVHPSTT